MRAVQKVTSIELLTKQAKGEKLLYTKHKYIVKLLLNAVTTGTEAFVVSENKFLYACVKEVYTHELSHILTSSINSLLLTHCDPNQLFK
jgi:hypothetical protein